MSDDLHEACDRALAILNAGVEALDGNLLAAVIMVHADGLTPNGCVEAMTDEEDGPSTPDDVLAFAVRGCEHLANNLGLPFAVIASPAAGKPQG